MTKGCVAFSLLALLILSSPSAEAASHVNFKKPRAHSVAAKPTGQSQNDPSGHMETYKDLIVKAQNLTLQRDRLQTSQILIRAIEQESNNAIEREELMDTLNELSAVFYTEKSQMLYATAESLLEAKPKDAIDKLLEALRNEEGNLSILVALSRAYLIGQECGRAESYLSQAEKLNPYFTQVKLLHLQVLDCQKKYDELSNYLKANEPSLESLKEPLQTLKIKELWQQDDIKKIKGALVAWEQMMPEYPEVYFWKWRLSQRENALDRPSALKYSQLCQALTPRKRKKYSLDVDLCRGKDQIDAYLKTSGYQGDAPVEEEANE